MDIPAGVDEGSTLRLAGHGPAGFRGGANGALFVHVSVDPDDVFERSGVDLHAAVHVPMTMAALGGSIGFATLDDTRELTITAGTHTGTVITLKGQGVPKLRGRGRGDLFVHVEVDTPTELDDPQRELLSKLAEAPGGGPGLGAPTRGPVVEAAVGPQLSMGPRAGRRLRRAPDPVLVAAAAMVFVEDPAAPVLTESDAHHLLDVLRLRPGEQVVVSDGAGSWAPCRLVGGGARSGPGRPGRGCWWSTVRLRSQPKPEVAITVAFAPAKGDRPEWVTQKLTELGVDRIVPLQTARSVVRWDGERGRRAVDRLRRVAREASAQSRRPWLPEVTPVTTVAGLAAQAGGPPCLAHPGGEPPSLAHPLVAVGPEGGWDDQELDRWGGRVGLGPTVLRAETAAVAVGTLLCGLRSDLVRDLA